MRVLEMVLVASSVLVLMVLLFRNTINRTTEAIAGVACGSLLAVQLLFEGYRWQMIPAYIVAALLLAFVLFRRRKVGKLALHDIGSIHCFAGRIGCLIGIAPVFHLPKPLGEFSVGTETFHFIDDDREESFTEQKSDKRELVFQVWYPALESGRSAEKNSVFPKDRGLFHAYMQAYSGYLGLPLPPSTTGNTARPIHLSMPICIPRTIRIQWCAVTRHGVGRILHTSQAEHLASHGYIVFAVDHTYSTVMTAFPDGRKTGFLTEQSQERLFEDSRAILDVWNKDTAFIVNQLEKSHSGAITSKFEGMLDIDNIGMLGHSFGGQLLKPFIPTRESRPA